MNSGPILFLGIFLTLASSFWGLLLMPQLKLGNQDVTELKETGELYPLNRAGVAGQGAEIYRSLGCAECHPRQVRPINVGGDIARGWGHRHSVAQDYIRDYPVLLGDIRVGPDLANAGLKRNQRPRRCKAGRVCSDAGNGPAGSTRSEPKLRLPK